MSTITNTALLMGLQDRDDPAWSTFYSRYQPVLVAFGRRMGLRHSDAQDAAQEALIAFADSYRKGQYDRTKGRLRTWLFSIASNKVRDVQRRNGRDAVFVDVPEKTHFMGVVPGDNEMSRIWETEWQKALTDACMEEVARHVEPKTFQAFELFVVREWSAEKVAEHLGLSRNAVFKAKRRVLTRMRATYQRMKSTW